MVRRSGVRELQAVALWGDHPSLGLRVASGCLDATAVATPCAPTATSWARRRRNCHGSQVASKSLGLVASEGSRESRRERAARAAGEGGARGERRWGASLTSPPRAATSWPHRRRSLQLQPGRLKRCRGSRIRGAVARDSSQGGGRHAASRERRRGGARDSLFVLVVEVVIVRRDGVEPGTAGARRVVVLRVRGVSRRRASHSSTSQLNLSRVGHEKTPYTP